MANPKIICLFVRNAGEAAGRYTTVWFYEKTLLKLKIDMETDSVKINLKKKWNIDPYNFWIPLLGNPTENTLYFDSEDFEKYFGYAKLNQIIEDINIGKIYSFNEAREENIYSEILLKEYNSPDIFFTNENADWVVYQTHEKTIAFAGKQMIDAIKTQWKSWGENVNPWEK